MQVDDLPMVTAVIPCHNHENWVVPAISSIVLQEYPKGNLRIMVVDDGSTDGSAEKVISQLDSVGTDVTHPDGIRQVCGTIAEKIQLILMIRPVAGGPSVARNLGMKVGMGGTDIFAFLDSDDMYQPTKIAASVKQFERSPKIGAVYSDFDTLTTSGIRIRQFKEPFSRDRFVQECIVNCDSLVLADAVRQCGDFDEEMRVCEDYDFWMRISEKFLISHLPESLVTIRVGEHSSSAQVRTEVWQQNWHRVMQKAQQRRNPNAI